MRIQLSATQCNPMRVMRMCVFNCLLVFDCLLPCALCACAYSIVCESRSFTPQNRRLTSIAMRDRTCFPYRKPKLTAGRPTANHRSFTFRKLPRMAGYCALGSIVCQFPTAGYLWLFNCQGAFNQSGSNYKLSR